ncbi:hypothetical protein BGZ65_006049 [Modicella reniformis]|uniref:DOPA 4,5-dioxygenase n=1 Tax=Modicella reniformis TaxID=1440133 RepID=A0A9P6MKH6_9FUNG|nr:hypothetical protein BGZ65_006049 [Modicella reniformis]
MASNLERKTSHTPSAFIHSHCNLTSESQTASEYDNEIKEFHFHLYWFQNNLASHASAVKLRDRILELVEQGFFQVVPLKNGINTSPRGPHPIGSYEVWCAREDFARCYSWFVLNRGPHSILIHPLTREEIADHSTRATWLGTPVPLDYSKLTPHLKQVSSQYPELRLGYNAPPKKEHGN